MAGKKYGLTDGGDEKQMKKSSGKEKEGRDKVRFTAANRDQTGDLSCGEQ